MTTTANTERPEKSEREFHPRILVVEDEAIVACHFQQRLTRMGYTVTGLAYDSEQAVQKASETNPELILMDINLGHGLNGIETAMLIRKQQDLPIIYITANSDTDTVRRAARSGPFGYILKPFEDRELETAIHLGVAKHKMELRLKESERRFNATLTSVADGLIATDPDGRIEFFNDSAEIITGWTHADVLGRKLSDVFLLKDDGTHGPSTNVFSPFLPGVLPGDSRTVLLARRDGTTIPIEYRAAHIHDERQYSKGVVISFSDITGRRHAEEKIHTAQQQLTEAHQHLQHKHEELQSFYHTVSHEVKTPLTSAREFVSLVMEGLAGPVTDTQKEYLSIAQESCDQMHTCINDMLDVTRLETGKMNIEFRTSSLADLTRRIVTRQMSAAERKGVHLNCTIKPGVGDILMDETRIAQVIGNLLNNALKFTSEGGLVSVVVEPLATLADHVRITVSDTGCGIHKKHLARIFDRLYQVRDGDASSRMGLGLGLYICHELVRLHNGSICVESVIGQGSTFYVTLPVSPKKSFLPMGHANELVAHLAA